MDDRSALIARAKALAPVLAERAREAEELRRLPDATIDDLTDAGFLDVLVPRAHGGKELDLTTLAGIARELGAGCTSTGWVTAIYLLHNWMVSLLPEKAQREVFSERPYAYVPCALAPTGRAEPVDGGYRLNGRWSWGSGVMHADWVMVMGLTDTGPRVFLLPIEEVVVHDVWHTSGMRGTGSNDIEVVDRIIPEYRSLPLIDYARGRTPGAELHPGPAYQWPMVPVLALAGAAPILGAAEGLLMRFRERLADRVLIYSGSQQRDMTSAQIRLGKANAEIMAARLLLDNAVTDLQSTYQSGHRYRLTDRARARLVAAQVVALARGVVNDLCLASGASAQFLHMPFQRVQRDIATISGHIAFDLDEACGLYGKIDLGIEPDPTALV